MGSVGGGVSRPGGVMRRDHQHELNAIQFFSHITQSSRQMSTRRSGRDKLSLEQSFELSFELNEDSANALDRFAVLTNSRNIYCR